MNAQFDNLWEVRHLEIDVGHAIVDRISSIANEQMPHFAELFPFNKRWEAKFYNNHDWFGIILNSFSSNGIPSVGKIEEAKIIETFERIFYQNPYPDFLILQKNLGAEYFDFDRFAYIGKYDKSKLSWGHIQTVLIDWLNQIVLPVIYERNKIRVLSAIPTPPEYNPSKILANTYILESEKAMNQGTCFHLKDIGLITCEHVIKAESQIFNGNKFTEKFPLQIEKCNASLDLAIFQATGFTINDGLEIGSSDDIQVMDHIAAVGFPNYRLGDTGIFSPGLVVGFRTVSGVRRILTNIPLIAGNSGGPVIDKTGKVIGVVVTGADRMEETHKTENHGIIPIEALKLLS